MSITTDQTEFLAVPAARGTCPFAPPPSYERAREENPVTRVDLWDGSQCWMVTGYDETRTVLGDQRFSADITRPGFPFLSESRRALSNTAQTFIRMDDPEHARLRRMLTSDFMLKKMEVVRPRIQSIAEELLDRMIDGRSQADLVADFALPLPSLVICLMLGVPYEDHGYFQDCSRTMLNTQSSAEEVNNARRDLADYMERLAEHKRLAPDDGIVSRLVERDELTPDQVASMGLLLLVAGHETTANMTALSVLALLRNPDQLARLREDPTRIKAAVEELLRYLSIVHSGLPRVASEDLILGGQLIKAGEGVVCMINTANRDEHAFPHGGELDVDRDARRHVAFGFGVHQCLGQPLARAELQIALETILRRLPDLRLATEFEDVSFRHEMLVYGVHALPVAW